MYHVFFNGDKVSTKEPALWDFDEEVGDTLIELNLGVKNEDGSYLVNAGIPMVVLFPVVVDSGVEHSFPLDCLLEIGEHVVSGEFDMSELNVVSLLNEKFVRGVEVEDSPVDKEAEAV